MNLNDFRQGMASYRTSVDAEGKAFKDSYWPLDKMRALYTNFDENERLLADEVISEWVLSEDEGVRFDALVLVDDFGIIKAVPTLRKLIIYLKSINAPGAPYELKKVSRIIDRLTSR